MKLMITSAGITNKTLAKSLKKLVKNKIKIAFIPTAANVVDGDKEWLIKDFVNCKKLGDVDIIDISALYKNVWLERLKKSNVIFVGGGDTAYLAKWIKKSGLDKELPELLKTRIYVGISAGSIVLSKSIQSSSDYLFSLYGDEAKNAPKGLGFIDFNVRPHFNSKNFPKVNDKNLKEVAKNLSSDLYALDDESAIIYNSGKITVVSEGKWKKYPV